MWTRGSRIVTRHTEPQVQSVRTVTTAPVAEISPERLNVFGSCPGLQINDINKVSISRTTGGDMGVHAESHMTEAEIRENEIRLFAEETGGARKCHSKLAAGPVCCYFINPAAPGKNKKRGRNL